MKKRIITGIITVAIGFASIALTTSAQSLFNEKDLNNLQDFSFRQKNRKPDRKKL